MKTRGGALLLVVLAVLTLAGGCNGADEISGPPGGGTGPGDGTPTTPVVTAPPGTTPTPCRNPKFPCES
jgi:hypothetical protein